MSALPCGRWILRATVLAVIAGPASLPAAGQPAAAVSPAATSQQDPEAQEVAAPVLIGGEPVIWITAGAGAYSPRLRAERIGQRVEDAVHDRTIRVPKVTVSEADGSSELRVGPRLLMVVTARDAASVGASRSAVAAQFARDLETAIRLERARYAPSTLLRSAIYGLVATLVLCVAVWLIQQFTRAMRRRLDGPRVQRSKWLRLLEAELFSSDRSRRALDRLIRLVRVALVVLVMDVYLTYVLGLFPWTRAVSMKLLGYALTPVRAVAAAFVGYLPKLLFLVVIAGVVYSAIQLVGLLFRKIAEGRLVFASFPAEWADPTNKIARVLLVAFGLVVAFPYLPASDSPAFAGVSVFIGVLVSLSSSSAFGNMIAGIVLTYTGAFRIGDRVQLAGAFGDIVETTLLATRLRTIKNEDITIPNSIVLGSASTNYSRSARTLGLILHTSVTIGYDAPWRKVHELLINAALATPGVLADPKPFVWQTALNDFYVTYEINAYTATPRDMIDIYAALHARIQDEFYAAGVEIMSPHYTSLRDGNTVAIPPAFRGQAYEAPSFRVSRSTVAREP